ncbi:MAG: YggB [Microgenomates group bacterium GW2011_GWA1_48_10]|uniref:Uncharacterized protein n=1 Tax=Candidatus Gottesmanbacteria bacterium RIFCSPHIGHO2_01_FULL_47_48 TaxID=1798381 RepID=A0A1F6A6B9_9BACT|nr:MAG: YggB [Microgenomates group bacterium GW2011_GWA1_48_10]OGG19837.1 MAG: hypothetical protein A2721_00440 [Candidatus Gottesmanbacteria bacterium RIFCSPHIGHO2_01_FULL_47_48]
MDFVTVVYNAMNQMVIDLINVVPTLIVALVIWLLGIYLLDLGVGLLKKVDFKGTDLDNKAINTLTQVVGMAGRVILVLIVLDYLGIARNVVGAVANGITFAVAIALGLSFGKALERDADGVVATVRRMLGRK